MNEEIFNKIQSDLYKGYKNIMRRYPVCSMSVLGVRENRMLRGRCRDNYTISMYMVMKEE